MASSGVYLILAAVVCLLILSGAHGSRFSRSKPAPRMESKRNLEPLQRMPRGMNQAEAHRVYSIRWNRTQSLASISDGNAAPNSRVFYVTNYGADPTGATDSAGAISKAINDAFNVQTGHTLDGANDLGGVEIHLGGGNYLVSQPIRLPGNGGGNVVIHGGSLRASSDFPADGYLIELAPSSAGGMSSSDFKFKSSNPAVIAAGDQSALYEDIELRDLMLDANFIGGGILVVNSVRTSIDNCYISHFMTEGITVQGGHETYIMNTFLGQHITAGGYPGENQFSGVGINLLGNDNAVTDVVIFSAAVGIVVRGQANIFTGVHCYNKATGFGGIGIHLQLPGLTQTRIVECYMDYTGIVAEDPVQLDISNSFFLGDAYITLKSTSQRVISGLNIVDNMFGGSDTGVAIVQLNQSEGLFSSIDQTVVDRNNVHGMTLKSTVAKGTVQGNGTRWTIDFSNVLLFPDLIQHVQYSFYTSDASFPRHVLRYVSLNKVVVESDTPVSATVAVAVDQFANFVSGGIYS